MKVSGNPLHITVSQANLAKALRLTTGRVNQLIKEGVVVRDDNDARGGVFLVESVRNYDRSKGASNNSEEEELDYTQEKARHEKVKREISELKLAKADGRVYDARTVELVMIEMLSNLRTQLLGLPSKMAPQLDGKSKEEIYTMMTSEIEDKLAELSEYSPELFMTEEIVDDEEAEE
ncbi:hypothetical protein [Selenomonas sp. AE3005]|uniref:hypothetical protein n=1 Tax=Selenomonas sp. AE3005 TaxID=1485543 RepID=UPI0025E3B723|nr:hypothetical protein [Selenomonas sp. AE3005]